MARGKTEIIEFANVDLVRELTGPGHVNLALIEQAFDVYLEAPGSSVVINGNAKARARAAGVIKEIYERLESGWPCTRADVESLIMGQGEGNFAKSDISQIIPVPRRKPVVPKTKHQGDFITAMRENTITFGVGPAGTGKTYTTLWVKERINSQSTLVLVPSLSLLSQTLREWTFASKELFDVLCVCSDETVGKKSGYDPIIQSVHDLSFPVHLCAAGLCPMLLLLLTKLKTRRLRK